MGDPLADAASPGASDLIESDASFAPSPPAASLCNFKLPALPMLKFKLRFKLPKFPPPLPIPTIALAINCQLKNPLSITADVPKGGGRKSLADPDPDDI